VGHRDPPHRVTTEDGLCLVFAVNVLAPYLLAPGGRPLITRQDQVASLVLGAAGLAAARTA
jgi:hypothetical protein